MINDNKTSARIDILRFPLIVGVVFIHNYTTTVGLAQGSIGITQNSAWVDFVRYFISQGVARVAVPLFFLMSGYLFFLGEWSREIYARKLKRRLHTLLIPYLFWNLATLAAYALTQSIPQTRMYFVGSTWPPVHSFSLLDYVNALTGIAVTYPISAQFWFIRDLMVLIVLAPAVHWLLHSKWRLQFLIALFCLWLFMGRSILGLNPQDSFFFSSSVEASFFFSLGAYLSQAEKNVNCLDRFGPSISAIFLVLVILNSAFLDSLLYLHKAMIVFGVPSLWWLTGFAARTPKLNLLLIRLSGASFFVFAAHEPLLRIIRKILYHLLLPTSGLEILALYFLIPIFLMAFLVVTYSSLMKTMPSILGFITGSSFRSIRQRV
jgi:fucose 4-O-acetylase-like acetyltransferase